LKFSWIFACALALTAWLSLGYLHPDEHFQILEALNWLKGTRSDLPAWEFQAAIRPLTQVYIFRFLDFFIPSSSPFTVSFIFRLLMGFASFAALRFYFQKKNCSHHALYLLCFVPFLLVRNSSENFSMMFLCWGMACFHKYNATLYRWGALFFAIAFVTRFQTALLSAPFMVASFLMARDQTACERLKLFAQVALVTIVSLGAGFLIDSYGYGRWVWTPWNYFEVNLIQGKAQEFGVDPWYEYFLYWIKLHPFITIPLLGLSLSSLIRNFRTQAEASAVFVFIAVHSLIGHKELRFLIPCLPALLYLCWKEWKFLSSKFSPRWRFSLKTLYWVFNIPALLFFSLLPYRSEFWPLKAYDTHYRAQALPTYYNGKTQPFVLASLDMNYYRQDREMLFWEHSLENKKPSDSAFYFFHDKKIGPDFKTVTGCTLLSGSFPEFLLTRKELRGTRVLQLYRCGD
jgi:GPI mannosyltransferase 3